MELDLTAGLTQLKTTTIVAELPESETTPESTSPSFAALLDTEPQPEVDAPTASLTQSPPPVMPPHTPDPTPAKVSDEATADTPAADAAAPDPKLVPPLITTPPPAQPSNRTPAAPLPDIQAPVQAPVRARPNQPAPAVATSEPPLPTAPAPEAKAPPPTPAPTTPTPPAPAILATTPTKTVPEPQAEIPAKEPEFKLPAPPEHAAPKRPKEPVPALASSISTAPLEPAQDQASELTFGLKIERQMVGTAHSVRPTPHQTAAPAPVASQISSQLPHLISKAEKQTVELRLDPPELGRVTIHITTHDQQVTALVVAERVDTVDLMRRHADLLTATLARAGFSQSDLSFQQGKGGNNQGGFEHFQGFSGMAEADTAPQPAPALSGLDGRLDIRL